MTGREYPSKSSRRQGRGERYAEGRARDRGRSGQRQGPSFRLFVAVEIPAEATRELLGWQQQYLAGDRGLRLTPEGQLHVTLVFLGSLGEKERDQAAARLEGLEARNSFEVTVTGLVGLPMKRSHPRVIAAGCDEPSGRLAALHSELAAGLVAEGVYEQEKRPYFPHVTIARARGRIAFDAEAIRPDPIKFTAVRVTLYNSVLKASGALHEALKTVQLN